MPYNLSITWLPVEKTHDVVTSIQKSVVVYNDNERNDNNHGTGVHLLLSSYESLLVLNCWQIKMFPVILHRSLHYWLIHSRTFLVQEAILPSRSPKVGWESNISELAVMQLGTKYEVAKLLKEIFAARPAKPSTCTFSATCEYSSAANNP